jgi:hypothetical protein
MRPFMTCAGLIVAIALTSCNNTASDGKNPQPVAIQNPTQTERVKPNAGKGNLQGQVMFNSTPVENIEVKLCEKFTRFMGGGCNGKTYKAKTDKEGYYVLTDIPPGKYEALLVRVFNTESYIFATKGFAGLDDVAYEVTADKTEFVDPRHLYKSDLKLANPTAGATVAGEKLDLKWTAYKDAAYYTVSLYPQDSSKNPTAKGFYDKRVEGTTFALEQPLVKGEYRWTVSAYNQDEKKLAQSADDIVFTVK